MKRFAAAIILFAATLAIVASSNASVVLLTGGDPGEGYAPLGTVFGAIDVGPGGFTVQGVNFVVSDPNIVLTNPGSIIDQSWSPFVSTTGDDVNLLSIVSSTASAPVLTLTISGLTAGTQYQVDSFVGSSAISRVEQVTAVGLTTATDSVSIIPVAQCFNVSQTLMPNAAGQIVVTYSITSGFPGNAYLNGVSVTSIPEPGSAVLFGLGLAAVALVRRIRRS